MSIVIVSAARTPVGRFLGGLSSYKAPFLGAVAIEEVLKRAKLKPDQVDEVIMGNVLQAGLNQNPARQALLQAGLPNTTNAFTVNKVCGSGLKAVMLGAQAIGAGDADIIIAGGFESMSNAPYLLGNFRSTHKFGNFELSVKDGAFSTGKESSSGPLTLTDSMITDGLWDCYSDAHMGTLAESLTKSHDLTREQQDAFALQSHEKAIAAIKASRFKAEIVAVKGVDTDEGPRKDTSLEKLASLKPVFKKEGTVTAGNASTINDGGAAVLLMSEEKAKKLNIKPLATIEGYAAAHLDPSLFMIAPTAAVKKLMERTNTTIEEYDLVELNEAFAVQSLAVIKELNLDEKRVNVNGGAIALGHPIGCSGARILVTLIYSMMEKKKKTGLATLCLGGGGAVAMAVRRG